MLNIRQITARAKLARKHYPRPALIVSMTPCADGYAITFDTGETVLTNGAILPC